MARVEVEATEVSGSNANKVMLIQFQSMVHKGCVSCRLVIPLKPGRRSSERCNHRHPPFPAIWRMASRLSRQACIDGTNMTLRRLARTSIGRTYRACRLGLGCIARSRYSF